MKPDRHSKLQEENLLYLRSWAGATEREIQGVLDAIASLEQRVERLRERLGLITRLADLVEWEIGEAAEDGTTIDLTEREEETRDPRVPAPEQALEGQLRQIFDAP